MAVPISEQILAKIQTRLGLIDEADGYETTTSDVVRPTRIATHSPDDYQLVVTVDKLTPNRDLSYPGNPPAQAWDMEVGVVAENRPSEGDTDSIDSLRNVFMADVIKAVTSVANWYQWDSLAFNTTYGEITPVETDTGSGFRLPILVQFRTDEDNPYNVR